MTSVLVTGSTGFIGRNLCDALLSNDYTVIGTSRSDSGLRQSLGYALHPNIDIAKHVDWKPLVEGIDCIVHLAAIAHETRDRSLRDAYDRVNVDGTRELAESAASAGVRRLIFVSSIKVLGEQTLGHSFSINDTPSPVGHYAETKWLAEQALRDVSSRTELEVVVIRPPLVYGPNPKGNLQALKRLIDRGIPIPIGALKNRRDFLSIYNLCDLITNCIGNPKAAGRAFLACDGDSLSTTELLRYLETYSGRKARIITVPLFALRILAIIAGKTTQLNKLASNLQIDMQETKETLDWEPPYTISESFRIAFSC